MPSMPNLSSRSSECSGSPAAMCVCVCSAGRVLGTEGLLKGRVGGGGWHHTALHFQ